MSVKAITSIDDHTIYGVGLHHGPSSEEVPTWKDHKGKADKSELEGKADKSVEDEFRNKDTGFKATRGWIEWLVNCMFNEIENDDKTKHPGVFKRIDSLSKDKADKKSIEESIKAIADKINSGGGIRDSLGNLLDEHLKQIGIECAKHESSIKAAINEHSEVRDKITRLVNEHCEFVNSKLGELKEYLDTCSNSFVAIKDELSGKQEIINNQLNEVSQKHSDFTFLCNKSEEIIANAISEIKDRADNFAKDADTRDGKIKDISDSTVKDLENKKTELTSL